LAPPDEAEGKSDQFELDARSSSKGTRRRVHFPSQADAREESRRFTLLSFQRPRRFAATKSLWLAPEALKDEHTFVSARSKALQFVELQAICTLLAEG
jgi:hypothetical protein